MPRMSTAQEEERQICAVPEVSSLVENTKLEKPSSVDNTDLSECNDGLESNSLSKTVNSLNKDYLVTNQQHVEEIVDGEIDEGPRLNGEEEPYIKSEEISESDEKDACVEECIGVNKLDPVQIILTSEQLTSLPKEELIDKWTHQDQFIAFLNEKLERSYQDALDVKDLQASDEKLKSQLCDIEKKEQYHIMRLATKEHEVQELGAQIDELKSLTAGGSGLKHSLLDPAVNLLFERMKRDLDSTKSKMEETQNELAAWKFTPDSNTGKQLMAKCRLLIKENEELGKMISSGRLAKLEGDLAMQRNFCEEVKKSQSELDEFLQEMDEDTEGMQGTILYLQSQLRQAKDRIVQLNSQLSTGQVANTTPASVDITEANDCSFFETGANGSSADKELIQKTASPIHSNGGGGGVSNVSGEDYSDCSLVSRDHKRTSSDLEEGGEGEERIGKKARTESQEVIENGL